MKKEAIIKLLSEPAELNKVSLEDLEELIHKFPYFHQLHGLLHKKKQQSQPNNLSENKRKTNKEDLASSKFYIREDDLHYEDKDEFEELEETNTNLPFHDSSFKLKKPTRLTENKKNEGTLPKEIVEQDMAYLLKKAGSAKAIDADDLTLISFINNNTQAQLNKIGLYTYIQFIKLEEHRDIELLSKLTGKLTNEVQCWKDDCTVLFQNKYHRILMETIGLSTNQNRDGLQKIIGIGPILEAKLKEVGIISYGQLALLKKLDINILTILIDYFPGRIKKDQWVQQAKIILAEQKASDKKIEVTPFDDTEIARLKAKVEAHKNLKQGIAIPANLTTDDQNNAEQARESFRDWLAKMNQASSSNDEKKNQLANDLTKPPPT